MNSSLALYFLSVCLLLLYSDRIVGRAANHPQDWKRSCWAIFKQILACATALIVAELGITAALDPQVGGDGTAILLVVAVGVVLFSIPAAAVAAAAALAAWLAGREKARLAVGITISIPFTIVGLFLR